MCREEPKATSPRADRFVSIAHRRSESADGGIARRAQGDAGRREDSARRIIECEPAGNRAGAQSCCDCKCAESVQHWGSQIGKSSDLLREGGAGLYALVSDWRRQRIEVRRCARRDCQGAQRERLSARDCMALATVACDAADSRHVEDRAPGRKSCCVEAQTNAGRGQEDWCYE